MSRRITIYTLISAFFYVSFMLLINLAFDKTLLDIFYSISFWVGLTITISIVITQNLWLDKIYEYIAKSVPIFLLIIGIVLIFLAYDKSLWITPPWEPSVFGAGVSITALGITLLTIFWSRKIVHKNDTGTRTRLSKPIRNRQYTRKANLISNIINYHSSIFIGSIASIALLIIFLLVQLFFPKFLALEWKWILVSLIPILLALIVGGYIRIFRGFGIEFETRLKEPITLLDLKATSAYTALPSCEKGRISDLSRLSYNQRRRIARLMFVSGRKEYYGAEAIKQHLHMLPNLQYFEVLNLNGVFVCLLPVWIFKTEERIMLKDLQNFVNALENNLILIDYRHQAITLIVSVNDSIIEVLKTLRRHRKTTAVVADIDGTVIGIIDSADIEKKIADEILLSKKFLSP